MLPRLGAATLLLALLTACGDDSGPEADESTPSSDGSGTPTEPAPTTKTTPAPSSTAPSSTTPGPTGQGVRIVAADSEFGTMLFDGSGQAIYLFDVEKTSKPECYDACAEAWPPVLTEDEPVAGPGLERRLLATTERADGTLQVTYNDHPLYFYAHEDKGEVKCHDVFLNGGNWYVVQPDGDPAPPT